MNGALDGLSEAKPTHGLLTFCRTTVCTPMRSSGIFQACRCTVRTLRSVANRPSKPMRAEIQNIVDEIKQSVGLLRRHL
jgi:hypothetical protein